jgi:hypothetical protein
MRKDIVPSFEAQKCGASRTRMGQLAAPTGERGRVRAEVPDVAESEDRRINGHDVDAHALDDPSAERRARLIGFAEILITKGLLSA